MEFDEFFRIMAEENERCPEYERWHINNPNITQFFVCYMIE
jgi:hypothetical protein